MMTLSYIGMKYIQKRYPAMQRKEFDSVDVFLIAGISVLTGLVLGAAIVILL